MFIAGFVIIFVMYRVSGFPDNDWRPLGIGFGFSFFAPLISVPLAALAMGQNAREALAAYALKQKMPLIFLLSVSAISFFLFITAIVSLTR